MYGFAHSGVNRSGAIRSRTEAIGTRYVPVMRKAVPKRAQRWKGIATMSDVLATFSQLMGYRARLHDIAQGMESVAAAWSRLELMGAEETFGTLQASAADLDVPRGCEPAQRALRYAMASYHAAMDRLDWAKAADSPSGLEAAWDYVADGDVLLALAIELTDKA
jgi:hypothetical protein